jgi:hypothetical protein
LALSLLRPALAELDKDNCHAIFACGHLIVKYAFAYPHISGCLVLSAGTGAGAEVVALLRGAFSLHDRCRTWLSSGPLGSCLEMPLDPPPSFTLNLDDRRLSALLPLFADSGKDSAVCREALNVLRRLFAMIAMPNQTSSTKTLVFSWPVQVTQEYLAQMSERKPKALVVLAHYCILLNMIDSFWFMNGCASRLLSQCKHGLGDEMLPYIQWPLSVVRSPQPDGTRG